MIIEDYYGFDHKKSGVNGLMREKSSNRTEKSQRNNIFTQKSPLRTLKRTELSNDKLNSRDSKKAKKVEPPKLLKQQMSKQYSSNVRMTIHEQDAMDSNQQQIEMMVKKYDNYKNTDSYQFKEADRNANNQSSYVSSVQNQDQYDQRGYRFEKETPLRKNRFDYEQQEPYYDKNYRSSSRGKNQQFLVHFQRQGAATNAIQRYTQNHSASNDIRSKKSRSLGTKFRPYKMHTFYNADMKQYCHYNQQGYMTERQYELLNKIEQKALKAYKRSQRPFSIQESSHIAHQNSGLIDKLFKEDKSGYTPLSSRKQSKNYANIKKEEKVLEVSINPKANYNDYQMSNNSKNKEEKYIDSDVEDSKSQPKQTKKDIFKKFANQDDSESSLLNFNLKKITQKQQPPKVAQRQDSVKRSSEISNDYKSVDMMEINSNYKPTNKQIKERNDFIIDDNQSLGMDTIRNQPNNVKIQQVKSERDSNLQISSSSSSSSLTSSQNISKDHSNKKSSKKGSNIQSKDQSDHKLDFHKNKMKKSYSMSEPYSQSSLHDLRKVQNNLPNKDVAGNFKKSINPLTESQRLVSSKDSISLQANNTSNNSQKVKIKRLTKVTKPAINQPQQHHFEDNLDALGVQSFQNYDQITESIKIKVNPVEKNSKISERSPKSEMQQASVHLKDKEMSKLKQKPSNSSFRQKSQASIAYRSKVRSQYNNSNVEYDLFGEIHDFIEMQEFDYHETRRAKEVRARIPDDLDDILGKIEDHLYIINCIAEIILLVPDVYDFETIYDKGKDWIFLEVFLTLKKFIFQRNRVVIALKGGKNCFNLLNYIVEDHILKKYLQRIEITSILFNLEECNLKLDKLMNNFYNFLIKLNKSYANQPLINLKPFRMNEDLVLLLTEYIRQVDTLKIKKDEEFKGGDISPDNEDDYEMMTLLNERIFRLMEMSFIMSNLAGREIKAFEKDEELFKEEEKFKEYLFQNQALFKETVKYFK